LSNNFLNVDRLTQYLLPPSINEWLPEKHLARFVVTDSESRIMPLSGGGFEQSYNAQACVDVDSMLVVANHITQIANDKKEIEPALKSINALPKNLGTVEPVFGIIKAAMGFRQFLLRGVKKVRGEWNLSLHGMEH
jgi:hypothetical protein